MAFSFVQCLHLCLSKCLFIFLSLRLRLFVSHNMCVYFHSLCLLFPLCTWIISTLSSSICFSILFSHSVSPFSLPHLSLGSLSVATCRFLASLSLLFEKNNYKPFNFGFTFWQQQQLHSLFLFYTILKFNFFSLSLFPSFVQTQKSNNIQSFQIVSFVLLIFAEEKERKKREREL